MGSTEQPSVSVSHAHDGRQRQCCQSKHYSSHSLRHLLDSYLKAFPETHKGPLADNRQASPPTRKVMPSNQRIYVQKELNFAQPRRSFEGDVFVFH